MEATTPAKVARRAPARRAPPQIPRLGPPRPRYDPRTMMLLASPAPRRVDPRTMLHPAGAYVARARWCRGRGEVVPPSEEKIVLAA